MMISVRAELIEWEIRYSFVESVIGLGASTWLVSTIRHPNA